MEEYKQEEKALDISKEGRRKEKNKYLLIGGLVVLVILAFLLGSLFNKGNGDKERITGVQPNNNEAAEKTKEPSKTPEAVIKEYLTTLQLKDYEKAADYISQNAKSIDKYLATNTAGELFDEFSEQPLLDFLVGTTEDTKYPNKKLLKVKQTIRDSWGNNKSKTKKYIMEVEKGEWRVNPTGTLMISAFNGSTYENNNVKITAIEYEKGLNIDTQINIEVANHTNSDITYGTSGSDSSTKVELHTDKGSYTSTEMAPFVSDFLAKANSSNKAAIYFDSVEGTPQKLVLFHFIFDKSGKLVEAEKHIEISLK